MQEPILAPGPQLHKSKDQNSNQESNESANQNSNKKRKPNDHARIPIKVGPGSRISSLHFTFFLLFLLFSSSLAAPPAGIQSDSDPKRSSACRFSAGCCHGSVQSDLLYPSLLKKTRAPSGRPPFAFSRSPLDSLLAGFLFFFLILDVAPLHKLPPHP